MPNTNTLCPKIGAAQWTCTYDECTCHLKESIPARHFTRAECESFLRQDIEKVGAAIACTIVAKAAQTAQLTLADEEPRCAWQAAHDHCRDVRCTDCPNYSSGLRN